MLLYVASAILSEHVDKTVGVKYFVGFLKNLYWGLLKSNTLAKFFCEASTG